MWVCTGLTTCPAPPTCIFIIKKHQLYRGSSDTASLMGNCWCPSCAVPSDAVILLQPCRVQQLFLSRQESALEGRFHHPECYCLTISLSPSNLFKTPAASEDPGGILQDSSHSGPYLFELLLSGKTKKLNQNKIVFIPKKSLFSTLSLSNTTYSNHSPIKWCAVTVRVRDGESDGFIKLDLTSPFSKHSLLSVLKDLLKLLHSIFSTSHAGEAGQKEKTHLLP